MAWLVGLLICDVRPRVSDSGSPEPFETAALVLTFLMERIFEDDGAAVCLRSSLFFSGALGVLGPVHDGCLL